MSKDQGVERIIWISGMVRLSLINYLLRDTLCHGLNIRCSRPLTCSSISGGGMHALSYTVRGTLKSQSLLNSDSVL